MEFQLTSPWGDEHDTPFPKIRQDHFNSRLREETNILCDGYLQLGSIFQLTSPQGDEHKSLVAVLINQLNFNSRLRKETNDCS